MAIDANYFLQRRLQKNVESRRRRGHRRTLRAANTAYHIRYAKNLWDSYCSLAGLDCVRDLEHCSVTVIEGFLHWTVIRERQRQNRSITKTSTLDTYWKWLRMYYYEAFGTEVSQVVKEEIDATLFQDLTPEHGLSRYSEPAAMLDDQDHRILSRYYWLEDPHRYAQGRARVQNWTAMQIARSTTSRPGAILERYIHEEEAADRAQRQQKGPKAICYKDLSLYLMPDPDRPGKVVRVIDIRLRFTKGDNGYVRP